KDNGVGLALDPSLLAADTDKALLAHVWDTCVVPALETAARQIKETSEATLVTAFTSVERRLHRQVLDRLPAEIGAARSTASRLEQELVAAVSSESNLRYQERALRALPPAVLIQAARSQAVSLQRLMPRAYETIELHGEVLVART